MVSLSPTAGRAWLGERPHRLVMLRSPDLSRDMNLDLVAATLDQRFGSDPYRTDGMRSGLDEVVTGVAGMSTVHSLTLLADLVACLEEGEVYLEVGSYRGRSLVGALSGSATAVGFGVENFGEFGGDTAAAREELVGNLSRFGVSDRASIVDGDAFRMLGELRLPGPVGVYLYDGVHSAFGQYAGLGLAEHLLADRAVVVVDDATWPQVARATDRYVAAHSGYRLLAEFRARTQDDELWCNGLRVYAWERPPGWSPRVGRDVTARAFLQSRVTGPARAWAWDALGSRPRAMQAVRRVVVRGGTTVPQSPPPPRPNA